MKQSKIISTIAKNWDKARREIESKKIIVVGENHTDFRFQRVPVLSNDGLCVFIDIKIPKSTFYSAVKI